MKVEQIIGNFEPQSFSGIGLLVHHGYQFAVVTPFQKLNASLRHLCVPFPLVRLCNIQWVLLKDQASTLLTEIQVVADEGKYTT